MTFRLICRFKGLLSVLVIALYSPLVWAVGFGNVQVYSFLNEPLSAEIKLFGVDSFSREQIVAQLGSPESFASAKIPRPFYLTKFEFDVVKTRDHGTFVYVSSKNPVQQPNVEFLVSLSWPDGKMLKEFTILLDPAPPSLAKMGRKVPYSQMGAKGGLSSTSYRPLPKHEHLVEKNNDIKEQISQKVVDSINEVSFESDGMDQVEESPSNDSDMMPKRMTTEVVVPPAKDLTSKVNESSADMGSMPLDVQILNDSSSDDGMNSPDMPTENMGMGKIEMFASDMDHGDMPINVIPEPKVSKSKAVGSTDTESKVESNANNTTQTNLPNKKAKASNESSASSSSLISMLKSLLPIVAVVIVIVLVAFYFIARKKKGGSGSSKEEVVSNTEDDLVDEDVDDISAEEPGFLGDDDDMEEEELVDEFEDDSDESSDGDSGEVKLRLAKQYIEVGENDSAIEILQELIAVGSDDISQQAKDLLDEL